MMNPNFLLNMPKLPNLLAEDCNVPALRHIRPYDALRKAVRVRRSRRDRP